MISFREYQATYFEQPLSESISILKYRIEERNLPEFLTTINKVSNSIQEIMSIIDENQKIIQEHLFSVTKNFLKLKTSLILRTSFQPMLGEQNDSENSTNLILNLDSFINTMSQMLEITPEFMMTSARTTMFSMRKPRKESTTTSIKMSKASRTGSTFIRPSLLENNIFSFNEIVQQLLKKKPSKSNSPVKISSSLSSIEEDKEIRSAKRKTRVKNLEQIVEEKEEFGKNADAHAPNSIILNESKIFVHNERNSKKSQNHEFLDSNNHLLSSFRKESVLKINCLEENDKKKQKNKKSFSTREERSSSNGDNLKKKQNLNFKVVPVQNDSQEVDLANS